MAESKKIQHDRIHTSLMCKMTQYTRTDIDIDIVDDCSKCTFYVKNTLLREIDYELLYNFFHQYMILCMVFGICHDAFDCFCVMCITVTCTSSEPSNFSTQLTIIGSTNIVLTFLVNNSS